MSPPDARSRPGEEAAHVVQVTQRKVYSEGTTEPAPQDDTARWAFTFMGQLSAEPLPLYGSTAFLDSPGPVRLASALRAAEAWRRDKDPHVLAARLNLELQAEWRAIERDYDRWRELAGQIRASANQPTHDELQRRRAS